jgi:hypothetical protein
MFYIVEEESKLEQLSNMLAQPCYLEVIPSNDNYHPKLTNTCAVYVRSIGSSSGYIIPINHNEGLNVEKERVYELLLSAKTLYTLNKKNLLYYFNLQEVMDLSLMYSMVHYSKLEYKKENITIDWYYRQYENNVDINKIIPIVKLYERSEDTYDSIREVIETIKEPPGFDFYNKTATNVFYLIEQNGIGVNAEDFNTVHKPRNPILNTKNSSVYSSYNLYHATSRPTNNFNSVNFAAINKAAEYRECFKPKNDFFVEFDFDGYHLRLLADQIEYELSKESAHKQLAKNYFGTEDISEEQYLQAKQINFHAIYGKIPEEHKNLKIFKDIQEYIDNMWKSFNEKDGYVWNTQSGKQFTNELKEMHPAKLMNYMMQSLETSNNITILKNVLRYLRDKKSFITLYTYDAILFDFSKEDGKDTLTDIKTIMENEGKYPVNFKYSRNLVL